MHNEVQYQRIITERVYRYRRKRRRRNRTGCSRLCPSFDSSGVIRFFSSNFIRHLERAGYLDRLNVDSVIYAPEEFSFKDNFDGCILFFRHLLSSFYYGQGDIVLSFKQCRHSTISTFSLLEVLLRELYEMKSSYNLRRYTKCSKEITVIHSDKDVKTNKYLHSFLGLKLPDKEDDGSKYCKFKLREGRQRNYRENPKTKVSSDVVAFINESTIEAGVELNETGKHAINGLIGEVLGNAEDHSAKGSYWYVDGISFSETQHNVDVVDVNLSIINVGLSMYEGFEETKEKNAENYSKCQKLYDIHKTLFTATNRFERESLFTLYMLNEGISRIKYKDDSRGNGTMRFLEAFIALGSFGNHNPTFKGLLNVISGHTVLSCDNDRTVYTEGNFKKLSLNAEKNLQRLPDKKYLIYNKEYFPGTLLECHIYLNKDHFFKILSTNG